MVMDNEKVSEVSSNSKFQLISQLCCHGLTNTVDFQHGDIKAETTVSKDEPGDDPSVTTTTSEAVELGSVVKKHPLQNKWQLWYWRNEKGRDWIENLLKVAQFDTVEDFWA